MGTAPMVDRTKRDGEKQGKAKTGKLNMVLYVGCTMEPLSYFRPSSP